MNSSVKKTKYLTEAAAAASITAILVLLKLLAPFLVFITMIASAVPVAVICKFHGMKWGLGTCAAEIFLVNILGGPEIGLTTAFYAAALGLAMGYGFRHDWSYRNTLHLTALAYVVEMSYKIAFSIYILGLTDALSSVIDRLITFVRWIWPFLSQVFGFDPDPEKVTLTAGGMVMVALLFILNGYCYAYLNQEIGRDIVKRLRAAGR